MIYELRTYTIQSGKVQEVLELYEKELRHVVAKYLNLLGYWHTESDGTDQVVQLYAFEDLDQRTEQREQFFNDPALTDVLPRIWALEVSQESKILIPAPFSDLK